jgi:hypothetical protein
MKPERKAGGDYEKEGKAITLEAFIRKAAERQGGPKHRRTDDLDALADAEEQRAALSPTTLFFLSR